MQSLNWEKVFSTSIVFKTMVYRICKEFLQRNKWKYKFEKWAKFINRNFIEESDKWSINTWKGLRSHRLSGKYKVRKQQGIISHLPDWQMAEVLMRFCVLKHAGHWEHYTSTAHRGVNWCSHFGKHCSWGGACTYSVGKLSYMWDGQ